MDKISKTIGKLTVKDVGIGTLLDADRSGYTIEPAIKGLFLWGDDTKTHGEFIIAQAQTYVQYQYLDTDKGWTNNVEVCTEVATLILKDPEWTKLWDPMIKLIDEIPWVYDSEPQDDIHDRFLEFAITPTGDVALDDRETEPIDEEEPEL